MVLFPPDFKYKVDRVSFLLKVMHWQQYTRHIILNYICTVKFLDISFCKFSSKKWINSRLKLLKLRLYFYGNFLTFHYRISKITLDPILLLNTKITLLALPLANKLFIMYGNI